MSAITPLRREEMSVQMHVGLYEGGAGERLHGVIDRLDRSGAHIWVPDERYGTALAARDRGFWTQLSYEQAEDGAMWSEPVLAEHPDRPPTGRELLDYWAWARDTGTVPYTTAKAYLQGTRTVLGHLPDGADTDLETVNIEATIAGFVAAHAEQLAPSTIAQYASSFRKAVNGFLGQRGGGAPPGTVRRRITLPDGRCLTILAPDPATPGEPDRTSHGGTR